MRRKYLVTLIIGLTILFGTHATSAEKMALDYLATHAEISGRGFGGGSSGSGSAGFATLNEDVVGENDPAEKIDKNEALFSPISLDPSATITAEKNNSAEIASSIEKEIDLTAEKDEAESLVAAEDQKPVITGSAKINVNYGADFPITNYAAKSASGKMSSPTLYVGIDSKKLGAQVAIVEATDTKTQAKKLMLVDVNVIDVTKPVITGQKNLTTNAGSPINLLAGLHANDIETGDLTKAITQKTAVDFNRAGTYTLVYEVRDASGNVGQVTSTLTVKAVAVSQASSTTSATSTAVRSNSSAAKSSTRSSGNTTASSSATAKSAAVSASLAANSIYLAGVRIPFVNGGTSSGYQTINANPYGIASTYYGSSFNGSDGRYTHFIGHSPGIFTPVKSVGVGSKITVTNGNGTPFVYTVSRVIDLTMRVEADGFAYPTTDAGQALVDALYYGEVTGETIVLQTCTDGDGSLIRFVYANR